LIQYYTLIKYYTLPRYSCSSTAETVSSPGKAFPWHAQCEQNPRSKWETDDVRY